jgi:hypothetical protein
LLAHRGGGRSRSSGICIRRGGQALTSAIAHAQETTLASGTGIIATGAAEAFRGKAALAVFATVDDILEALALARFGDARPVEVLARLCVVDNIGEGRGGYLALSTTRIGRGAGVEVGRGVDGFVGVRMRVRVVLCVRVVVGSGRGMVEVAWRGGVRAVDAERWEAAWR